MAVVFDEVIATIDPPAAKAEEPESAEESASVDDRERQLTQWWELQQRKAKRLLAE